VVPFIVTLGTMTIFVGIGHWLSENKPIRPTDSDQVPFWLQDMVGAAGKALWFNTFPTGVFLLVGLAILLSLTLRYTVFGRHVYALGSNEATARLCGINVSFTKVVVYSLAGVFVGLAGLCHFATVSLGDPESGLGMELKIIAAVVIGGGSLNGGRGAVLGTLAGAAIMQVIDNGCTHLELDVAIQRIILGAIIITAVTIDQLRERKHKK
jgi:ribose transport system permease protein